MAKYIIERDERDIAGGDGLITIATFDNWEEAKAAWEATPVHANRDITMWFAHVTNGTNVLDSK